MCLTRTSRAGRTNDAHLFLFTIALQYDNTRSIRFTRPWQSWVGSQLRSTKRVIKIIKQLISRRRRRVPVCHVIHAKVSTRYELTVNLEILYLTIHGIPKKTGILPNNYLHPLFYGILVDIRRLCTFGHLHGHK